MEKDNQQINNGENLKNIRTYMTDMADSVRANEISVLKVALAEQNKHEREDLYRKVEGTPVKKVFWFIGGILFIALAIYGTYFLLKEKKQQDVPQQITKVESVISYDETSSTEIVMGENLIDKINVIKNESTARKNSSIKLISVTEEINGIKETAGVKDLFSNLGFTAPSSLTRALLDTYMIGTYTKSISSDTNVNNEPKLFMVFQPKDYEYVYAGMLEWEKTMASNMVSLFDFGTSNNTLPLDEIKFKDIIINNKDARVLLDKNNKAILYYMFTDKNNLIITSDIDTIKEVITRLIAKNIKPL